MGTRFTLVLACFSNCVRVVTSVMPGGNTKYEWMRGFEILAVVIEVWEGANRVKAVKVLGALSHTYVNDLFRILILYYRL